MAIVVVMGQQLSFRNFSNRYELDGVSFCSQASPTKLAARASAGNLCEMRGIAHEAAAGKGLFSQSTGLH